jgi:GNAT superfamily N-acetyltransferase
MMLFESISSGRTAGVQPQQSGRLWRLLSEDWQLEDGTPVTIRPIRASDKALELAFVSGLSRESRYQRLLSARDLLPGELRRLTDIDYAREMALIATTRRDGVEEQMGVARYVRDDDGESSELAIVVGDQWQRRGLGEKLLRSLLSVAADAGVRVVNGITLTSNAGMLAIARKLGFSEERQPGDATITRIAKVL